MFNADPAAAEGVGGADLSATLKGALTEEVVRLTREQWLQENRDAIAAYNEFVDEHSTFAGF